MTAEDFWWSPSMGMLLTEKDGLVWVVQPSLESLRHRLGTGPDSNPPMPFDAVHLAPAGNGLEAQNEQLRAENERLKTELATGDQLYARACAANTRLTEELSVLRPRA